MEQDRPEELPNPRHGSSSAASTATESASMQGDETPKRSLDHDSMVTVRLSEPPPLTIDTSVSSNAAPTRRSVASLNDYIPDDASAQVAEEESDPSTPEDIATTPGTDPAHVNGRSLQAELLESNEKGESVVSSPDGSDAEEEVDWDELQKSEDQEPHDKESDDATALLLARLEQENDKLATNPKTVSVQTVDGLPELIQSTPSRKTRPPSMAQLRHMVHGPTPPPLRYSMLPPPPMTDLEFYAALVKDYQQTASRLPTLLTKKIRKGIPPPLRGVVWQSMAGAREPILEDLFDKFCGESSPYEGIIGKDLGRSFPGVDMFRDADGDGQRMLGRVLKCFSLYDQKIGYCQGLAFIVGPLLMHMPDKQAFCVLVRLMENYDLRTCFLPDLSGLHVRIYQFRELLRQCLPTLWNHLDDLQVDPAYVSQWFLSFFATTCPLPMLFRIYDVIFAEGASPTIMRVALSLMRRNERRILACSEFEDVMQLLLSRGLWDCYHYNADEFVLDFVSLSGVVTQERLQSLDKAYRECQIAAANAASGPEASTVSTQASRFLGRLWSLSTNTTPKSGATPTLSPGLNAPAPSRPISMLQRSASKQSLASMLSTSMEASSSAASVLSSASASTEATSLSRDSSNTDDSASSYHQQTSKINTTIASNSSRNNDSDNRNLHSQIEDLLTALSELQRNHTLLANQLQQEREDRDEDKRAVRSLLDGLRKKASTETVTTTDSDASDETVVPAEDARSDDDVVGRDRPAEGVKANEDAKLGQERGSSSTRPTTVGVEKQPSSDDLSELLDIVEQRFSDRNKRRSSTIQTKSQMRDELSRAKEQLRIETSRSQDLNRRVLDMEQEAASLKDQLRDSHTHVRNMHQEKQRLERQIHGMRARASADNSQTPKNLDGDWTPAMGAPGGGLRELRLGRSQSTPSQNPTAGFGKRTSSLINSQEGAAAPLTMSTAAPANENEALLLELVQAKTAEAVARQEADEARQKLEHLRKAFGLAPGETPPVLTPGASTATSTAMGVFSRFTAASTDSSANKNKASAPAAAAAGPVATATPATSSGGGFWGWRR